MTKQEFINNFNLKEKLKKIDELKNTSFEDWFLNVYGPHLENSIINGYADICLAKDYDYFEKIYFKKTNKDLSKEELENYNHLLKRYTRSYENRTTRLEKEIADFHRDLEYFCEEPNLSFEEWLNSYYIKNLKKLPEDLMHPKHKEMRLLRVDVFNGKLDETEFLEMLKFNPTEAYQSKDYIISDYKGYLQNQVTLPTVSWIE